MDTTDCRLQKQRDEREKLVPGKRRIRENVLLWLIIQDHDQAKFNRDIYQSVDCSMAYLREMYKTLGWKWEISQAE